MDLNPLIQSLAKQIADRTYAILAARIVQEQQRPEDAPAADQGPAVRPMLTAEMVMKLIPVSRTTLFRLEQDGRFPRGHAVCPHRKLWFQDEVVAWQESLLDPDSSLRSLVGRGLVGRNLINELEKRAHRTT